MKEAENTPPEESPAELQFDTVERGPADATDAAGLACAVCAKPITEYYDVDGKSVCASCMEIAARANEPARGTGLLLKAFLYGGVAAVLGAAIYYAVIAITNFEIGLVALLIGFMVGAAVQKATAGRGGRRFQVMALLLTYFAVGLAYTPLAVKGAMESAKSDSTAVTAADSSADSANVTLAARDSGVSDSVTLETPTSGSSMLIGLGVVLVGGFLMAFALPIFAVLSSMPSGLISALIIGVGMHQAWKMTAAQVHRISGPYRVGSRPPAAT